MLVLIFAFVFSVLVGECEYKEKDMSRLMYIVGLFAMRDNTNQANIENNFFLVWL